MTVMPLVRVLLLTAVAVIALPSVAGAKPAPTSDLRLASDFENSPAAWSIYAGPAGAMLEANYFSAPQGPFRSGRIVPCRLNADRNGEALRLAYACH